MSDIIKEMRVKQDDGNFSSYPLGAKAENIEITIQDQKSNLLEQINNLLQQVNNLSSLKAEKYHASTTQEYGVGSESRYGHLKISDNYESENPDGELTAISQAAMLEIYKKYLDIFYVIEDTLFSTFSTAFEKSDNENALVLLEKFFAVSPNGDGTYTLEIK